MVRSVDDIANKKVHKDKGIPDFQGAATGLLGVKAPASYRQTGDIEDRLQAAGPYRPYTLPKRG